MAEKMAGEITLSDNPGETLKKWRNNFEIAQNDLAAHLDVSPSVISDYESGRRKSPGTVIVGRIVDAILDIDESRGGAKIRSYESILRGGFNMDVIHDIYEYAGPMSLREVCDTITAEVVEGALNGTIHGYTVIDSLRAIIDLSVDEFYRLYGWSTERVMIFTDVSTGKGPMVALRVTSFKPGAVVLHGISADEVEPIARKIARIEQVPLLTTTMPLEDMLVALKNCSKGR